jgi:hypothetical protein
MSTPFADLFVNPYAAPQDAPIVAEVVQEPPKPGSISLILGGFVLLVVGYLTSNLFAIADLYGLGMGPGGQQIPSPLGGVLTTPLQKWLFYVATASACIAGAVMLGSQRWNPFAVVCYVMCPIVGVAYFIAWPLRSVKRYAEQVATVYLLIGSILAFTGGTQLFLLYGNSRGSFAPVIASLMTEVGVALMLGALLKFWHASPASPTSSA